MLEPPQSTARTWLDWLALDGWLDEHGLVLARECLDKSAEPVEMASMLVQEGLVTPFQAKNLIAGSASRLDCGRYRIRKRLGKGGMGEVFAAEPRDRRDIPVAIKILQIDESMPPEDRKRLESRFVREMRAGRDVTHPNVTRTVDFGRDADRFFLVMPRLKGPSLAALIEAKNRRPELKTIVRMAAQVVSGLEAIHKAGLVHRDLKPSNILYDGHKNWKILDLGLAKALGDRLSLTRPGVILGTLDYAAPEQLKDATNVGSPADFYALGCILYHAMSGEVPFEGGDAVSKIYRHRMTPPEPLMTRRHDLPVPLAHLVDSLLRKEPAERPAAETVRFVLEELLQGRDPAVDYSSGSKAQPSRPQSLSQSPASSTTDSAAFAAEADSGGESFPVGLSEDEQGNNAPLADSVSDFSISLDELENETDGTTEGEAPRRSRDSRLVVPKKTKPRPVVKRSPELQWALQEALILLLTMSFIWFLVSLRALWRHLAG